VSDGTRTRDRLDHNQELYLLSYAHQGGPLARRPTNLAVADPATEQTQGTKRADIPPVDVKRSAHAVRQQRQADEHPRLDVLVPRKRSRNATSRR
jgi:hypothetical protein